MSNQKPLTNPYNQQDRSNQLMAQSLSNNKWLLAGVIILASALGSVFVWKPIAWESSKGVNLGNPKVQYYIDVAELVAERRYNYTPKAIERGQYDSLRDMIHPKNGIKLLGDLKRDEVLISKRKRTSNYELLGELRVTDLAAKDKKIEFLARHQMDEGMVSVRNALYKYIIILRPSAGSPFGMLILDQYQERLPDGYTQGVKKQ